IAPEAPYEPGPTGFGLRRRWVGRHLCIVLSHVGQVSPASCRFYRGSSIRPVSLPRQERKFQKSRTKLQKCLWAGSSNLCVILACRLEVYVLDYLSIYEEILYF